VKTAVSFYTFVEGVDIREAMEQCKNAGYDGVEVVLSETGNLNMKTSDAEITAIKRMADDMGLKIPSVGAWNIWSNNLVSNDPKIAAYGFDIIQRQLHCAAILGADTILAVPGYVGTPFAEGVVRYDLAYERAQEAISKLGKTAKELRVSIGVENVWNKFLLSPLEMRRFIDEIGNDYVGAYFDVGNIIYIGYPEQWISILGKRIKKLHFCDCRFDQAGLGMFVDLFEGDVDFEAVMAACKEIGYDDWAVVEFLPNYKRFPYQSIINARLSMDRVLAL
jgi:hexulose-6-phosphate isomerase